MSARFDHDDELPRAFPDDVHDWQENIFFSWFDVDQGIGGVHRIGQWPNQAIGNYWSGIVTDAGKRFRRFDLAVPLTDADRDKGISVGPYRNRYDGDIHLSISEPEASGELRFTDYHDPVRYWGAHEDLSLSREFAADHYEASGRVRGTVTLDGDTYEVDGFGHRDHSWGPRKVDTLICHRWLAGSVGPQLSWSVIAWLSKDGELLTRGYVVRDGVQTMADSVDLIPFCEPDGITHRGGWGQLHLPGEQPLTIRADYVDGLMFGLGPEEPDNAPAYYGLNGLCRANIAGQPVGFTNFEMSNNARQGRAIPPVALRATQQDGLSINTAPRPVVPF